MEHKSLIILGVVLAVFVAIAVLINTIRYFTPDGYASVVTGFGAQKIYIRQAFLRIPIVQRVSNLYTAKMSIDIRTSDANQVRTRDMFPTRVDANANVSLALNLPPESFDRYMLSSAPEDAFDIVYDDTGVEVSRVYNKDKDLTRLTEADRLRLNDIIIDTYAGKTPEEVQRYAEEVLNATLREAVGSLDLLVIQSDKDAFGKRILELAIRDLMRIGLIIDNFNIQDFKDTGNTLEDLGENAKESVKEESEIQKNDSLTRQANNLAINENARHEAEKKSELAIAKRDMDQEVQLGQIKADKIITLAKQEEASIDQVKITNIARVVADADVAEANNLNQERVLESSRKVKEQELAMEQEVVAYASGRAKQVEMEAENRIELDKVTAQLKASELGVAISTNKAKAIKIEAAAEAERIEKIAEARGKLSDVEIRQTLVSILPELVRANADNFGKIGEVTIFGGADSVTDYVNEASSMSVTDTLLKQTTGLSLKDLIGKNVDANIATQPIVDALEATGKEEKETK